MHEVYQKPEMTVLNIAVQNVLLSTSSADDFEGGEITSDGVDPD